MEIIFSLVDFVVFFPFSFQEINNLMKFFIIENNWSTYRLEICWLNSIILMLVVSLFMRVLVPFTNFSSAKA